MKILEKNIGYKIILIVFSIGFIFGFAPRQTYAISCGFGTNFTGRTCRGYLTTAGAAQWTVPTDWNNTDNTIEVIGGGGGGCGHNSGGGNGGGGGGAYAKITNFTSTAGTLIDYTVGAGGIFRTGGGDTWFGNTTCAGAPVCGDNGLGATAAAGVSGGVTANSKGTLIYDGGDGKAGNGTADSQGGGGGAAGPYGVGGDGGPGDTDTTNDGVGGGGGGNGGGTSGGSGIVSDTVGADGGDNFLGTGGGQGGSPGAGGTAGGGGGGGDDAQAGGDGGNGTDWDSTHGSGGGGGGGGDSAGGGNGGTYGGGGGGGVGDNPAGAQGIIVITYSPGSPQRSMRLFRGFKVKLISGRIIINQQQ